MDDEEGADPRHEVPPQEEPIQLPDVTDPFANPWNVLAYAGLAIVIALATFYIGAQGWKQ